MDPRLLRYYTRELQHIREMCGEFAKEYPKIAARLGLEGLECADPYVERLLEGFGYMAARVQLKVDAEFPRFTQHLLEMVYPHYLAPMPSMAMVQFQPDLTEGALGEGFVVPRGSALRSRLGKGDQTPCDYRTAHDVTLWPLELIEAEYLGSTAAVAALGITELTGVKAGFRWRFRTTAGLSFDKISLDGLQLYLRGTEDLPMRVYEQLLANPLAIVLQPARGSEKWREVVAKTNIRPLGFHDAQALLPYGPRSFQGYRLLQEYFAFPERYMMVELTGLAPGVRRCTDTELDVIVLLSSGDSALDKTVDASHFALFCSPAINLFEKRADRIHLTDKETEHHIVPDRSRPMDFEVYAVSEVQGIGTSADQQQEFKPFYGTSDVDDRRENLSYYTLHRTPRVLSSGQRSHGPRSSYIGSEVFVSLVDANEAPYGSNLRQLALTTLCTNRDLPLHMPVGAGQTDFTMESGAPVESVRCLAGPTRPRPSHAQREVAWQLISHLSLNYLSLTDTDRDQGGHALRQLLELYGATGEASTRKQIEGVVSVASRPVNRRILGAGPISFARGLEVEVTLDESAFEGTGIFLLGVVLEQFFARYVSINSFTETVLKSTERGEVMRWTPRIGQRHVL
jgi:type VI secretion system protein ImpG